MWLDDEKIGNNCEVFDSKGRLQYAGGLLNGKKEGKGTSYNPNGNIEYEGFFRNDELTGPCRLYFKDKSIRRFGAFKEGAMYGMGCEHYMQGKIESRATFHKNEVDYGRFFV
jgi:antitoxin component YwqK of YwqJK toxin-antitoxin module